MTFPTAPGAEILITSLASPDIILPSDCTLVLPVQTHTTNVSVVSLPISTYNETDGLISTESSLAVGIRTADCVPVLLYATDIRAVAAVHAGWKGTLGGISTNAIARMTELGASPGNIHAFIGPAICGHCYEVGDDVARKFLDAGLIESPHHFHLDLRSINRRQLLMAGLKPENITVSDSCTKHSVDNNARPAFPSWRREPGTAVRLISAIRLID